MDKHHQQNKIHSRQMRQRSEWCSLQGASSVLCLLSKQSYLVFMNKFLRVKERPLRNELEDSLGRRSSREQSSERIGR